MDDLYEWAEPKAIMAFTMFLILFDGWGKSVRDGFSRWTIVRCAASLGLYAAVIFFFSR